MAFGFTAKGSLVQVLSTELNGLAATLPATSATITPPAAPIPFYADWVLNLASYTNSAIVILPLFFLPATDDTPTNFAGVADMEPVGTFKLSSGASAKRPVILRLPFLVRPFKAAVVMPSGATSLAASGSTLHYSLYAEE
jgi:hypothetical protein